KAAMLAGAKRGSTSLREWKKEEPPSRCLDGYRSLDFTHLRDCVGGAKWRISVLKSVSNCARIRPARQCPKLNELQALRKKRQRAGALQDAIASQRALDVPPDPGLRRPSAAFGSVKWATSKIFSEIRMRSDAKNCFPK